VENIPHVMKNILISITAALVSVAGAQTISIKGSDTLGAKLVPQLAEAFKASGKSDINFEIAAEGSSTAFPALANGTAQIGMSSRKIKEDEATSARSKGMALQEIAVCHDMLAVIVNKNNPLSKVTKDQIAKIFTGQSSDWSEVGGTPGKISVYTRNTSSGTYKDWQSLAMGGRDYPSSSQKLAGNEQIVKEVSANKNGIGYVGLAYAKATGIKALPIDGIAPIAKNAKTYVYARECYLYTLEKPNAETQAFLDFIKSPAGQDIIRKVGFVANGDL